MIIDINTVTEQDLFFRSLFYSNGRDYLRISFSNIKGKIKYKMSTSFLFNGEHITYSSYLSEIREFAQDLIQEYNLKQE